MEPAATIRFQNGVLHVGLVPLGRFAGYEVTDRPHPPGWPVLSRTAIISSAEPAAKPRVLAAVFAQNEPVIADPATALTAGLESLGVGAAPVIDQGVVTSSERSCSYRVAEGAPVGFPGTTLTVGVVVAAGTAAPSVGVVVSGSPGQGVDQLVRDIAADLCV